MGNKIANPISENYPKVGISNAFHNKILKNGHGKAAWGNSYEPSQLLANELFNHILSGGAWTPGIFEGNRRQAKLCPIWFLDFFANGEQSSTVRGVIFSVWLEAIKLVSPNKIAPTHHPEKTQKERKPRAHNQRLHP